jgi:hypothetical protein
MPRRGDCRVAAVEVRKITDFEAAQCRLRCLRPNADATPIGVLSISGAMRSSVS